MSAKQDKATTERHAKVLRGLLKSPENKVCADCKRNDPRWASWNLGVFLCIRCSGIHRSMGTHISKVKSVDLDVWTVEQMNSVQKWGNRRANIYWEAHLKAGHVPPDHKIESFIRSKYESRRWAMEGPPPADPSVLDGGDGVTPEEVVPPPISAPPSSSTARPTHAQAPSSASSRSTINRQPQPHQLLSAGLAGRTAPSATPPPAAAVPQTAQPAPAPAAPVNDLFSLDFHNPTPPAAQAAPKKDVKQDILSLFSTPAQPTAPAASAFGQYTATAPPAQQNVWGQYTSAAAPPPAQISMMGNAGTGMWGVTSGWNAPAAPAQPDLWGTPAPVQQQPQQSLFNTNDIWASASGTNGAAAGGDLFGSTLPQKKDDTFGDLWGGFK
ncbi:ArfGap-domain-containing protein [Trametopsis cervina]|nr:ArfGap-domain-containing protein [Trametopsis cervina]